MEQARPHTQSPLHVQAPRIATPGSNHPQTLPTHTAIEKMRGGGSWPSIAVGEPRRQAGHKPSIKGRQSLPIRRAMPTDNSHNFAKNPKRCSPEDMEICRERNNQKEEQNGTHPNSSSRSSLSIAVTLASSIARCTNREAWEARNHCCVGGEKAREHAWRQTRMDECSGASGTYPACASPVLDPAPGAGKLPTRVGRLPPLHARTLFWPNTTWCGHALSKSKVVFILIKLR